MGKSYKEELVGVIGFPVDENPSVVAAQAAFEYLGLNFRYLTIEVQPRDLENAIKGIRALNFKGINLTIPHKCEVLQYLDIIADDAKLMGAVNTIYTKDGKLYGENTDGKGFTTSLNEAGVAIKGTDIVLLGAGGAARSVAVELAMSGAKKITIVSRPTGDKGSILTKLINDNTTALAEYVVWDGPYSIPANTNIVVNATSIGLYPNVDEKPNLDYNTIMKNMVVCDVIPNHPHTAMLKEAEARGARTLDGLNMLINQAATNFKLWTGRNAPIDVMTKALKAEFGIQ